MIDFRWFGVYFLLLIVVCLGRFHDCWFNERFLSHYKVTHLFHKPNEVENNKREKKNWKYYSRNKINFFEQDKTVGLFANMLFNLVLRVIGMVISTSNRIGASIDLGFITRFCHHNV